MKKKYYVAGMLVLAVALSFYIDNFAVDVFSKMQNIFLNEVFLGITFISSEIIIFFLLTSLFLWKEHKRRWILPLWLTLLSSVAVGFILKILVKRPRPFQLGLLPIDKILESGSYLVWNFSFPSFQTMLVFCALPLLSKEFPKIKWFWIVFAVLVGISRLYFGLHFLSDVVIGGIIGYFIGMLIVKLEEGYKFGEKIWKRVF